jgi:hypothetical protein
MNTYIGTLAALTAAASAMAIAARDGVCCFELNAASNASSPVGQLADGQNRIGGKVSPGSYCITADGTITDAQGRGCILTRRSYVSPTTVEGK